MRLDKIGDGLSFRPRAPRLIGPPDHAKPCGFVGVRAVLPKDGEDRLPAAAPVAARSKPEGVPALRSAARLARSVPTCGDSESVMAFRSARLAACAKSRWACRSQV